MTDTQNSAGVPMGVEQIEDVIVSAIANGIEAWKKNDEAQMDAVIALAVCKLSWPERGDDGRIAVVMRLEAALDETFPYAGCRDDLRALVTMADRNGALARITELEAHIAAEPDRMREVVERCAKVAEGMAGRRFTKDMREMCLLIATAIRAQETGQ